MSCLCGLFPRSFSDAVHAEGFFPSFHGWTSTRGVLSGVIFLFSQPFPTFFLSHVPSQIPHWGGITPVFVNTSLPSQHAPVDVAEPSPPPPLSPPAQDGGRLPPSPPLPKSLFVFSMPPSVQVLLPHSHRFLTQTLPFHGRQVSFGALPYIYDGDNLFLNFLCQLGG